MMERRITDRMASFICATLIVLTALAGSLHGQLPMTCSYSIDPDSGNQYPVIMSCQTVGDPAYISKGEVRVRKADLGVSAPGAAFSFVRTYLGGVNYHGPLGNRWDFAWNARLQCASTTSSPTSVTLWRGDNTVATYPSSGYHTWSAPAGRYETLIYNATSTQFEATYLDGTVEVYERTSDDTTWFRLKTVTDRSNNTTTVAYAATTKDAKISTVTDSLGRAFTFTYDSNGFIGEIADFGTTPRRVKYEYSAGSGSSWNLWKVTELAGESLARTTIYTYDSNDRIKTITDPKQAALGSSGVPFVRNWYDSVGRLICQEYGDSAGVDRTSPPSTEAFFLSYPSNTNTTLYTDRSGTQIRFTYDATTRLVTKKEWLVSSSAVSKVDYEYDSSYRMTTLVKNNGDKIQYTYDSYGNTLTSSESNSSGGNVLTTTYTYTGTYPQLATVTDPDGVLSTYSYDSHGNLTQSVYDSGSGKKNITTSHTYNSSNHDVLTTTTDPNGVVTAYYYDSACRLTKTTVDTGGLAVDVAVIAYNEFGHVTSMTDALGKTTTQTVDRFGRTTEVTAPSPLSYSSKFYYDPNDNLTRTEQPNASGQGSGDFVTTYTYDKLDHVLTKTEDIDGSNSRTVTYTYDADEKPLTITSPLGAVTRYTYDDLDRNTSITVGYGTSSAATTQFFYDANHRLTKTQAPLGSSYATTLEYDCHDRATKATDALGSYVVTSYGSGCRVESVKTYSSAAALLADSRTFYDTAGRVTKTEVMSKDASGTNMGDGWATVQSTYDACGRLTTTTDEASNVSTFAYDALGRLTLSTDAIGNTVAAAYDACGRVVTRTDVEKTAGISGSDTFTTNYEYDVLGRCTKTIDPGSQATYAAYGPRGQVTSTTDALGAVSFSEYDELNRLTKSRVQYSGTSELVTQYYFDKDDRLTKVKDARSLDTVFGYDVLGRTTSETYADASARSFTYDANSNMLTSTDANGNTITYTYDLLNRVTEKDITAGANGLAGENGTVLFWYDALSRLTKAEGTESRIKYTWNTLGLTESEEQQYGATEKAANAGRTVEWDYLASGLVSKVRYPGATSTAGQFEYAYDALNRMTKLDRRTSSTATTTLATWTLRGPSRVTKRVNGNGSFQEVAYDSRRLPTAITHTRVVSGVNKLLEEFGYSYDAAGQLLSESAKHYKNDGTLLQDKGFRFAYDKAARLTKVHRGVPASAIGSSSPSTYTDYVDFALDANGNRSTVTTTPYSGSASVDTYTTNDTNAYTLISFGGSDEEYTYDTAGNRIGATGLRTWKYDYQNHLVEMQVDSDNWILYKYDALGRRMEKFWDYVSVNGGKYLAQRRFAYAGGTLIQEYRVLTNEEEEVSVDLDYEYAYGQSLAEPVWFRSLVTFGGTEGYYHQDGSGSVYALTSAASGSAILENYRYTEYGEPLAYAPDTTNVVADMRQPWLWHARYYDAEIVQMVSGLALYGQSGVGFDPETNSTLSRTARSGVPGNSALPNPNSWASSDEATGPSCGKGPSIVDNGERPLSGATSDARRPDPGISLYYPSIGYDLIHPGSDWTTSTISSKSETVSFLNSLPWWSHITIVLELTLGMLLDIEHHLSSLRDRVRLDLDSMAEVEDKVVALNLIRATLKINYGAELHAELRNVLRNMGKSDNEIYLLGVATEAKVAAAAIFAGGCAIGGNAMKAFVIVGLGELRHALLKKVGVEIDGVHSGFLIGFGESVSLFLDTGGGPAFVASQTFFGGAADGAGKQLAYDQFRNETYGDRKFSVPTSIVDFEAAIAEHVSMGILAAAKQLKFSMLVDKPTDSDGTPTANCNWVTTMTVAAGKGVMPDLVDWSETYPGCKSAYRFKASDLRPTLGKKYYVAGWGRRGD